MLFADLKGSIELLADRDPEESIHAERFAQKAELYSIVYSEGAKRELRRRSQRLVSI